MTAFIRDPLTAARIPQGADHVPSYWAATAGPPPTDDGPLASDRDAEVAIIGAGYTGLSCAYYLAKSHGIDAVVLEANRPGWGCTGRNGGNCRAAARICAADEQDRPAERVYGRLGGPEAGEAEQCECGEKQHS